MEHVAQLPLARYTSFEVGGIADDAYIISSSSELLRFLQSSPLDNLWLLGYGCNALISDKGLTGTTLVFRGGEIIADDRTLIADAGVWWDDLVTAAISKNLWGLELMSGIPGSVGAAIVGNIAAYGQAVSHTLAWVEVFNTHSKVIERLKPEDLALSYRYSSFQEISKEHLIIIRAAFTLSNTQITALTYHAAISVAEREHYDIESLDGRRQTILNTRAAAGSLWDFRDAEHSSKNAGSIFRNPLVTKEQADMLISYDETGRSAELIKQMNQTHGGDSLRVSSAHVLLAAGFKRGQSWGPVRIHPDHILKIENTGGATAQEIYGVITLIQTTVQEKLSITIIPEVRFIGDFS